MGLKFEFEIHGCVYKDVEKLPFYVRYKFWVLKMCYLP